MTIYNTEFTTHKLDLQMKLFLTLDRDLRMAKGFYEIKTQHHRGVDKDCTASLLNNVAKVVVTLHHPGNTIANRKMGPKESLDAQLSRSFGRIRRDGKK